LFLTTLFSFQISEFNEVVDVLSRPLRTDPKQIGKVLIAGKANAAIRLESGNLGKQHPFIRV
jgi:hypothetical protein